MLPCSWWGAAVVMGFLLHGDRLRVMEKKLTNSGPFRELVDKHSIYTIEVSSDLRELIRRHGLAWVHHKLAGWLADTSQHGARDDITLGMISRLDQRPPSMLA